MLEIKDLLDLPWATLITLACGYMAYFIANVGKRDHHKTIDVVFSVLVFGFPSAALYRWLTTGFHWREDGSAVAAVALALGIGAMWSWMGRDLAAIAVRKTNISHSNDYPAAWSEIGALRGKVNCTQLSVFLKDGTSLHCDDLSLFNDHPNGPFVLGASGDVLMYVTRTKKSGKSAEMDPLHSWGALVTYVPADEVARIQIRRLWRRTKQLTS